MTQTARAEILELAKKHNITHQHTGMDRLAEDICRLSDSDVPLDEIEWLLVELRRAGIIKTEKQLQLVGRYIKESRANV